MPTIHLDGPADFAGWRAAARSLAQRGVAPADVLWSTGEGSSDLFAPISPVMPGLLPDLHASESAGDEPLRSDVVGPDTPGGDEEAPLEAPQRRVPRRFVDLAEQVVCHRDPARFDLLYRMLRRLERESTLLDQPTDDDVFRAGAMAKAVRRERHKMTAFVRFRAVETENGPHYVAWFEPDHHVVALTAPFFTRRFAAMRWSILTPEASAHWDGETLSIGSGAAKSAAPTEDALEETWRTYYAHIFNPARLKIDAMKREMPVRYWKNLPESPLIAPLIRTAQHTTTAMIEAAPTPAPARAAVMVRRYEDSRPRVIAPSADTLAGVAHEAAACRRCPLFGPATQTVFGEGAVGADLMFVGEQPGDTEDLAGKPFVGPAGRLFDRALGEAGIERRRAYITNAVKHFKFEPRGKTRLHQKPNAGEIDLCRTWLEREAVLVRPKLTIAMGASALRGLTGRNGAILRMRGQLVDSPFAGRVFVTVHPSFLLRVTDRAEAAHQYGLFVDDLRAIAQAAAEAGARTAA